MVKISIVNMKDGSKKVKGETPYHPDFPGRARSLGGNWNARRRAWYFDTRDEARVRELCVELFGMDGSAEPLAIVDCSVTLTGDLPQSVWFGGREILHRFFRDSRVQLGEKTVVVSGKLPSSGGSQNHPRVGMVGTLVLEVRDAPLAIAEREKREAPDTVMILSPADPQVTLERNNALLGKSNFEGFD